LATRGFEIIEWDGQEESEVIRTKIPFDVKHLSKNVPEREKEKLKKTVAKGKKPLIQYHVKFISVQQLSEGSVLLTVQGEKSIHLFRLNKQRELEFSGQIPICQLGAGAGFTSCIVGTKLVVFFNDRRENVNLDWNQHGPEKYTGTESQLSLVELDLYDEGQKQTRKTVWTQKDIGGVFNPFDFYWASKGGTTGYFFLQGSRGKQRMLRFEFLE